MIWQLLGWTYGENVGNMRFGNIIAGWFSIFQCLFVEKPWKWENLQRPACVSGGGETTRRGDAGSHGPCQCEKSWATNVGTQTPEIYHEGMFSTPMRMVILGCFMALGFPYSKYFRPGFAWLLQLICLCVGARSSPQASWIQRSCRKILGWGTQRCGSLLLVSVCSIIHHSS